MKPVGCAIALTVAALLWSAAAQADSPRAVLQFARDGTLGKSIALSELIERCGIQRVEVEADPYYGQSKIFWACPLRSVLEMGFGRAPKSTSDRNFFLRALDGFTKPATEARLAEAGGWLAVSDAERGTPDEPRWDPIDRRQVDPAPFYLIWSEPHQNDIHHYPWPYQLATIEIAPFETEYPHTLPASAAPDSPARAGFAIFRAQCIACHAINGEGGLVGPDLNVPRSIVEYRPAEQIKAYIRNPQAFRYTTMPSHTHLSDAQLDSLVAYFEVMKNEKWDLRAGKPAH